jgi:hypothetical protein
MVSKAPWWIFAAAAAGATLLPPTAGAESDPIGTDDRGFIGTDARCDEPAVAFGRTEYALIAICGEAGQYEYRGVRLSDDALLSVAAVETADGVFSAQNDDVTYEFSAKELAVWSGKRVVRADPMVAYVEPSPRAEG